MMLAVYMMASTIAPLASSLKTPIPASNEGVDVKDLINKDHLNAFAEDIANISENYPAYRVAGSMGSNMTANYILDQFLQAGLDAWKEEFIFTNWDLKNAPSLTVDIDGDWTTDPDKVAVGSFSCDSYSWPSDQSRPVAELVYLPMPPAVSYEELLAFRDIPYKFWDSYNITGRVAIIPQEARWNVNVESVLMEKLKEGRPLAVISAYWYSWNSFASAMSMASTGGRPLSPNGDYFWDLKVPTGTVNYSDGVFLREIVDQGGGLADMRVDSIIYQGAQENIVAKIEGTKDRVGQVLITAHYDSVMCTGYIDNAAGVAALIEMAHIMKRAYDENIWRPDITLMFIAFSGEELGYVGSTRYATSHELGNIKSVINLDSIGGKVMRLSGAYPDARMGIDKKFIEVAEEEGVTLLDGGSIKSDHMSFAVPGYTVGLIWDNWRRSFSLTTSKSVPNSYTVFSSPLTIYENEDGQIGLIHTIFDTPDPKDHDYWHSTERLYSQVRVITGVTVWLASGGYNNNITDPTWQPYVFALTMLTATVLVAYVFRKKIKN
ncbi:MAG: M28 family peptidase [Methanomassiliicoccales archaeon]|nr:MAG: M28 family peptidase [Methanomassiliicoccales archaeon]